MFTGPGSQLGSHPTQGFPPLSHSCTPHPWTTCPMTTCFFEEEEETHCHILHLSETGRGLPTSNRGQGTSPNRLRSDYTINI